MTISAMNSAAIGTADSRIKADVLGIIMFLCGATSSINVNLIGEVYVAELLLIPTGLLVLLFKGDNGVLGNRSFRYFLAFGIVTLIGYMITDLVIGTQPSQYLRGWGRVGLLISNALCLMIVVGQGRRYVWWFILGMGVGGVVYLALTGTSWSIWKLGYAERVSMIVLAMSCVLPRRIALLGLAAFGILNIGLDYRNFAAVYLLVVGILWMRSMNPQLTVQGLKRYFVLGVSAALALTVLLVGLSMTQGEYGARRADSNAGRWSGIIVSLRAIADSPIIGYGSWTENEKYTCMLQEEERKRFDHSRARRAPVYGVKIFRAHSQILQSWVEAGILGVAFFIYYGYRLAGGARSYILDKPIDRFSAINLYFVILGAWNLLASPFGGESRILIAVTAAILAAVKFDDKQACTVSANPAPPVKASDETISLAKTTGKRILRYRNQIR